MTLVLKEKLVLEVGGREYPLLVCGPGSSSMDAAWDYIRAGDLPVWGAVLMESQSGGRGRMGRVWQSPPGHIYGALRLPESPPFDGPGASLALAFLLARALGEMGAEVRIKWPNDLIIDGGKTGGILLESKSLPGFSAAGAPPAGRPDRPGSGSDRGRSLTGGLVAGVGLNLLQAPAGGWAAERDPGAPRPGALPFEGGPLAVWPVLVKKLITLYNEMFVIKSPAVEPQAGPDAGEISPLSRPVTRVGAWTMAEAAAEAEKILFWKGRQVRVVTPASEPPAPASGLQGRIIGLAPDGCLLLAGEASRYKLWSGTVCLA